MAASRPKKIVEQEPTPVSTPTKANTCSTCAYSGRELSEFHMQCDIKLPVWLQLQGMPVVNKQSVCDLYKPKG